MAQRIIWKEPTSVNVDQIEISRSTTKYGTYTVIDVISATSDSQPKDDDNEWITSYTDFAGQITHWYKVRFYDSVNDIYSDYSEPLTAEKILRLSSVREIRDTIETVGRWTDDEIFKTITREDDLIYIEAGTPIQAVCFDVLKNVEGDLPDTFYVGEENIYRIDRVFLYHKDGSVDELYLEDDYKANNQYGMIRVKETSENDVEMLDGDVMEIHYVPRIYNKLSIYRTAKRLLEQTDLTKDGKTSKELKTVVDALREVEKLITDRIGVQLSSHVDRYDGVYGVNRRKIVQNYRRNNAIAKHGWV